MHPNDPHGIEHEPHVSAEKYAVDSSETKAADRLRREGLAATEADAVEHTVWSEPALSDGLVGEPGEQQLTYPNWLANSIQRVTWTSSLGTMILVAMAAGPWAVLSAFYGSATAGSLFAILGYTIFGPVTEEVGKVAAALWVVEKRPFLFRSQWQIFFCAACGGLAFAAIENLLYIYVYIPKHSPEFVWFRWTVCVILHVSCSLVAAVGLARIWRNAIRNLHPPQLPLGVPWFVTAMVVHGLYNLTVIIAGTYGWIDLNMPEPVPPE